MEPMEAGARDRVVTLQQLTESQGATKFPVESWTTLVESMPAARRDITGRERFAAEQISARYDVSFEINYRPDMDPDLVDVPKKRRVLFHGRVHDIVFARQIGMRDGIELLTLASGRTS